MFGRKLKQEEPQGGAVAVSSEDSCARAESLAKDTLRELDKALAAKREAQLNIREQSARFVPSRKR